MHSPVTRFNNAKRGQREERFEVAVDIDQLDVVPDCITDIILGQAHACLSLQAKKIQARPESELHEQSKRYPRSRPLHKGSKCGDSARIQLGKKEEVNFLLQVVVGA